MNIDGEAMYTDKVRMKLERSALRLIVPQGLSFFGVSQAQVKASAVALG